MCVSYFSFLYNKLPEERKLKSGKVSYAPEFQSQSNHSGEDMMRTVHHVDGTQVAEKGLQPFSCGPVSSPEYLAEDLLLPSSWRVFLLSQSSPLIPT